MNCKITDSKVIDGIQINSLDFYTNGKMIGSKVSYSDGYNTCEIFQDNKSFCPVCEKQFNTIELYNNHLFTKIHREKVIDKLD
jgi:hypothetical protein